MKRTISVFLAMLMLALLLPFGTIETAEAATSGTCGDNLTWTLDNNGTLTISGTGSMADYYSTVYPPWYSYRNDIVNVIIEDSVKSIGDYAFSGCTSLETITIADSVTGIGDFAFDTCISLTSISIGNSVTTIGDSAFSFCTSLESVTIPDSMTTIGWGAFNACTSLKEIKVSADNPNYKDIDGVLFDKAGTTLIQYPVGGETNYTIPDGVTTIGDSAFFDCTSLESITIPDSVTGIGVWAFSYCTSLTSITIPDSVTTIEVYTFYRCTSLTSISIGNSVTRIEGDAFIDCTSLKEIKVSADNPKYKDIDGVLFNKAGKTLFQYPASKTETDYIIPDSVTTIGGNAFNNCTSLESITIPDSVTSIGDYAFCNCDSLESVTIGNSVTTIGDSAFSYCTSLESVTIPDSVTTIGAGAFFDCTSLKEIKVSADNPNYKDIDGVLFDKAGTTLIQYPFGGVTNYTIPDGVTIIGDFAFDNCISLESITIPGSVTTIGDFAFDSCISLESAVFYGEPPTSFGEHVFVLCASDFTIYYHSLYASSWTPNGRTTWNDLPIVSIESSVEEGESSIEETKPTIEDVEPSVEDGESSIEETEPTVEDTEPSPSKHVARTVLMVVLITSTLLAIAFVAFLVIRKKKTKPSPASQDETNASFCPNCGNECDSDSNFCRK